MTFLKPFPFEDSPFFQHTVGFDRMFDQLNRVQHDIQGRTQVTKYPPYNIVKTSDDEFQIEQILMEAGAYGLRSEVDHYARRLLEKNPLSSRVDAYVKAYHEIIKD